MAPGGIGLLVGWHLSETKGGVSARTVETRPAAARMRHRPGAGRRRMDVENKTPRERAMDALESPDVMCDLLADCRSHKVPGWWQGSAYRKHPVGLIVGTIKLTNHWHVSGACDIAITDGEGWDRAAACQNSLADGDPHPPPINGVSVTVWDHGRWVSSEFRKALEGKILEILTGAAEHIEAAKAKLQKEQEAKAADAHIRRAAVIDAAIQKAQEASNE